MMSKTLLLLLSLLVKLSFAQIDVVQPIANDHKIQVIRFIQNLKLAVNSNNQSLIDKLIFYELDASKDKNKLERKPLVNDISYYSNININVNDVIISNPNEAMVLGNISLFDNKNFLKA